jgi:hypothetical protein
MRTANHNVGDLVIDNFNNVYIVLEQKTNRDGIQVSILVSEILRPQEKPRWKFSNECYYVN